MLHYPLLNMIYNSLKIRPKCMDWTIYRSSGTRTQSTVMSLQLGEVPLKAIILKMYLYTCLVMLCYVVFDTKSNLSHAALYLCVHHIFISTLLERKSSTVTTYTVHVSVDQCSEVHLFHII